MRLHEVGHATGDARFDAKYLAGLGCAKNFCSPNCRELQSLQRRELRMALRDGTVAGTLWPPLVGLTACAFGLGTACFVWLLHRARATGRLGRLGQD